MEIRFRYFPPKQSLDRRVDQNSLVWTGGLMNDTMMGKLLRSVGTHIIRTVEFMIEGWPTCGRNLTAAYTNYQLNEAVRRGNKFCLADYGQNGITGKGVWNSRDGCKPIRTPGMCILGFVYNEISSLWVKFKIKPLIHSIFRDFALCTYFGRSLKFVICTVTTLGSRQIQRS